jgi:2-polyprenyl-6-methoxyphenol hydroxylase-like FAD-dependent oxidoreductase
MVTIITRPGQIVDCINNLTKLTFLSYEEEADMTDVIVVGAGPTGLMLARELRLAGVRVEVLEKLPVRSIQSKAGGLHSRTSEIFRLRGLLDQMQARARDRLPVGGHFAGLPQPLDFASLDTRSPYIVATMQVDVEDILETELAGFGTTVRRGHQLTALLQDDNGVRATVAGPDGDYELAAKFLVGCDGGRSTVRKLIKMPFPGTTGTTSMVLADVLLDGDGLPSQRGHFSDHIKQRADRLAILSPLPGGLHRLMFGGSDQQQKERDAPVTDDEIREMLADVYGPSVRLREIRAASRFTDASRQVENYRSGRVLLAGDAAHIHLPSGGQGMNLGIQDAFNLGWKLAATVRGDAPAGLLDTYQTERHPVGLRVLQNTRAQGALMAGDPNTKALRELITEWLAIPELNHRVAAMVGALDIRYDLGSDNPLVGSPMPDLELETPNGPAWFSDLTHDGRSILLDFTGNARPDTLPATVRHVAVKPHERLNATTILIRPDGHVASLA